MILSRVDPNFSALVSRLVICMAAGESQHSVATVLARPSLLVVPWMNSKAESCRSNHAWKEGCDMMRSGVICVYIDQAMALEHSFTFGNAFLRKPLALERSKHAEELFVALGCDLGFCERLKKIRLW